MNVSAKTQQRLVQRYPFDPPTLSETNSPPEPIRSAEPIRSTEAVSPLKAVSEVSLDGGMVRLVPPPGVKLDKPLWQQYKAVCLDPMGYRAAWFNDNESLVAWVKQQPLTQPVICLGDGHDGIWNLFTQIAPPSQRYEILEPFLQRMLKEYETAAEPELNQSPFQWAIGTRKQYDRKTGKLKRLSRSTGTVQKDWTAVKRSELGEMICIAVIGHGGWDNSPDADATYVLVVSLEAIAS